MFIELPSGETCSNLLSQVTLSPVRPQTLCPLSADSCHTPSSETKQSVVIHQHLFQIFLWVYYLEAENLPSISARLFNNSGQGQSAGGGCYRGHKALATLIVGTPSSYHGSDIITFLSSEFSISRRIRRRSNSCFVLSLSMERLVVFRYNLTEGDS